MKFRELITHFQYSKSKGLVKGQGQFKIMEIEKKYDKKIKKILDIHGLLLEDESKSKIVIDIEV